MEKESTSELGEHEMKCNNCGKPFDMRDLGQVFYHENCTELLETNLN